MGEVFWRRQRCLAITARVLSIRCESRFIIYNLFIFLPLSVLMVCNKNVAFCVLINQVYGRAK